MTKKKSGLNKDISSIFAGLEEVDNGRAERKKPPPPPPEQPEPEKKPVVISTSEKVASEKLSMDGTFPRRRNAFLGLDIGSSSIKLVQIYPVSGGWEIGGYAIKESQLEIDEEGLERQEALLGNLKELIAETRTKNQLVISSLRGEGVHTSLIPMARMPKKELDSACRLEAKRRASFNVDKAFLQSHLVSEEAARAGKN